MLMRCRAIEQPCIAGFGREQDQPTNRDDASVVVGRSGLDMRTSSARRMLPPSTIRLPVTRLTDFRTLPGLAGFCHGPVLPAVRQLACLRLTLLRPHSHI